MNLGRTGGGRRRRAVTTVIVRAYTRAPLMCQTRRRCRARSAPCCSAWPASAPPTEHANTAASGRRPVTSGGAKRFSLGSLSHPLHGNRKQPNPHARRRRQRRRASSYHGAILMVSTKPAKMTSTAAPFLSLKNQSEHGSSI